jgi:hypothetical protein
MEQPRRLPGRILLASLPRRLVNPKRPMANLLCAKQSQTPPNHHPHQRITDPNLPLSNPPRSRPSSRYPGHGGTDHLLHAARAQLPASLPPDRFHLRAGRPGAGRPLRRRRGLQIPQQAPRHHPAAHCRARDPDGRGRDQDPPYPSGVGASRLCHPSCYPFSRCVYHRSSR